MTYTPERVEQFSGLNLTADPGEVGWNAALDVLNVDTDRPGALRSRDGYARFSVANGSGVGYVALSPYYKTDGTRQLIAAHKGQSTPTARPAGVEALDSSGNIIASQGSGTNVPAVASIARFAAPGQEHVYVAVSALTGAATVYRWDGTTWTTPVWVTTTPTGRHLATWQNRLVNARRAGTTNGDSPSTIRFSNITSGPPPAADPLTWNANDFIELSPGDGEEITALVTWRDSLFAFKESRFFVFFGVSTDSSGNPIFNYRPVIGEGLPSAGGVSAYRAACASPAGVYFLNRRGIWFTDGGPARLISGAMDPIFRGTGAPAAWNGGTLNQAQIAICSLVWYDKRLFFSYPTGSGTRNTATLVFNPETGTWCYWDIAIAHACGFRIGNVEELVFASNENGASLASRYNLTSGYIQDGGDGLTTGVAITSRYRSGFHTLPPSLRADGKRVIRQWHMRGSGTVTFGVAADDATAIPTTQGGAQSSVSLTAARPNYRTSQIGNNASWQVSATSAWRLDSLQADLA